MIENSEDKIINAAIEVFAKRGFDIATTDEIANATVNRANPIPTSKEFIPNANPSDPMDV